MIRLPDSHAGFTLLEVMLASVVSVIILIAIYGLFSRAVKMRDTATENVRDTRMETRAVNTIRNDLRNAYISGGTFASLLQTENAGATDSSGTGADPRFPGYLKFTTTTGRDTDTERYGDIQQVEYYITSDNTNPDIASGGKLVRVITRDLLDATQTIVHQDQLLSGVQSLEVAFYDGAAWQQTWQLSGTGATSGTSSTTGTASSTTLSLPQAVRIDIQQVAADGTRNLPAPLEILVPWTGTPYLSGTNFTTGTTTP